MESMYTKVDLIENSKIEKILRNNKYKMRNLQTKKKKKQRLTNIFEKAFNLVFWTFMIYFIYQIVSYLFVRL